MSGHLTDRLTALLDSAIEFVSIVAEWIEQRLEGIVRDKVVRPLTGGCIFATAAALFVGTIVFLGLGFLTVGSAWLLAGVMPPGLAVLLVGLALTAVVAIALWRVYRMVTSSDED